MLSQIDFNATILIRDNKIYIPILGLIFNNINGKQSEEVKLDFSNNRLNVGDILYNDINKYNEFCSNNEKLYIKTLVDDIFSN